MVKDFDTASRKALPLPPIFVLLLLDTSSAFAYLKLGLESRSEHRHDAEAIHRSCIVVYPLDRKIVIGFSIRYYRSRAHPSESV